MCTTTPTIRVHLAADPAAPAAARALVEDLTCGVHDVHLLQLARLLVSEVVTNAVVHGAGPITVELHCEAGTGLVVRVHDEGPGRPRRRRVGLRAQGGRGIALVEAVATAWGVEATRRGKTVWFHLNATCAPGRCRSPVGAAIQVVPAAEANAAPPVGTGPPDPRPRERVTPAAGAPRGSRRGSGR